MIKNPAKPEKQISKDDMFESYFNQLFEAVCKFQTEFEVSGVCQQMFGDIVTEMRGGRERVKGFAGQDAKAHAQARIRATSAWQYLSDVYDYAVDGIVPQNGNRELEDTIVDAVGFASDVLTFVNYPARDEYSPTVWDKIIARADGRFALDMGDSVPVDKVAYLANVDIRTVRNAISAGELKSEKVDAQVFVDNASALAWLNKRRGFKPTQLFSKSSHELRDINTPSEFGALLVAQRNRIESETGRQILAAMPAMIDTNMLSDIECGIFNLPLSDVFVLSDIYQFDRKEFLLAVMRIFYKNQLNVLLEVTN